MKPTTLSDDDGELVMSGIHTYGEVVHLFIERENYRGAFMPGFRKWESVYKPPQTGLQYVDHCVGNVGLEPDESVGEVLRGCDGISKHPQLRRQEISRPNTRRS